MAEQRNLHGRNKIFCAVEDITRDNVVALVNSALTKHAENVSDIDYLYWYRRGVTPILRRKKEQRPEICNRISNNIADSVVAFKNGYFLEKPAFYTPRRSDDRISEDIKALNEYLYASGKNQVDNEVVNWFHTVGIGTLYIEPNTDENDNEKPVNVYALDPRQAFVVYSYRPGNRPLMGINMVIDGDGKTAMFDVFTEKKVFKLRGSIVPNSNAETDIQPTGTAVTVEKVFSNVIGKIPIIEYTYNENRMSCYEAAIPLLDSYNTVLSNDIDGIEQFIQSLVIATNVDFEEGTTQQTIREAGMICLKSVGESKADIKVLAEQLDQEQTHITLSALYDQILERCGVPSNMREQRSTSDNVGAVYLRNGWSTADTCARCTEDLFKQSNRLFDEIFLRVLEKKGFKIGANDYELKVPRNDMSNILLKSQSAKNLKDLGMSPELVFERSGLSNDPVMDVARSDGYIQTVFKTAEMLKEEEEARLNNTTAPKPESKDKAKPVNDAVGNWVEGYYRSDRSDSSI